ncbi:MAG: sodC [Firmicutes bacterium]|nr:sodC [Bacillota bacterium]
MPKPPIDYPDDYSDHYPPRIAVAILKSGPLAPNLKGRVFFTTVPGGTEVLVEVSGLPPYHPAEGNQPQVGPHGFHIHENGNCEVGDCANPFSSAGSHWNPHNQPHGNHAGDFPALFSNHGYSCITFFTDKFQVSDIIGKSVVIHQSPDDYHSQPAGSSGKRLACGIIKA